MTTAALDLPPARATYDALAPFYDDFTAHHDYDDWTTTLERVAIGHGLKGGRLLDVACGTGKSFLPFVERSYSVTGCDVSPRMLELARAKAPDTVELYERDVRDLGVLGSFDLVTCLDDALNYLLEPKELLAALTGLGANLAESGVLVFDVNTLLCYRSFFAEPGVVESPGQVLLWQGRTPADAEAGVLATATLDAYVHCEGECWRRVETVQHQRHHPRATVEAALAGAGLACLGVYGMHLDGRIEPGFDELRNSKAVYVAGSTEGR